MKKLKWLLIALVGVPVVLIAIALVLVFSFDANQLKPILVKEADKQGIALTIDGDLGWQIWPNLAVTVEGVALANSKTRAPLAELQSAALSVELMPLFSGSVKVNGIDVQGVEAHYVTDKNGQSQWPEANSQPAPAKEEPKASGDAPSIEIKRVALADLTVNYRGADQASYSVRGLNLRAEDVNLAGRVFAMTLDGDIALKGQPVWSLDSEMMVSFALDNDRIALPQWSAALNTGDASINLGGKLDIVLAPDLAITGTLDAKTASLRALAKAAGVELPVTRKAGVLAGLNTTMVFEYAGDNAEIERLNITLDDTKIDGRIALALAPRLKLTGGLNLDAINVDDYLAPESESEAQSPTKPEAPPAPLPVDALQSFDADFLVQAGAITVAKIPLTNASLGLKANKGLITVTPMAMSVSEGKVDGKVTLDARQPMVTLDAGLTTQGISLAKLMQLLEQDPILAGELNSQIKAQGKGQTDKALTDSIVATIEASSAQVKLSPVNIERRVCEAMALLKGKTAPAREWPEYSELSPLRLEARYQNGKVQLTNLNASIQQLNAQSQGELDLATGDFRFPLDVKLADFAGGLEGCVSVDEKWRSRAIPLRCKGNLSAIDAKVCLPDGPRITDMIKDKAKEEVKEELDKAKDKAEDKAKKEVNRALDKHLGEEKKEALKDSIKGLLGR